MTEINLTQIEADRLIALEKHFSPENNKLLDYPSLGGKLTVPLFCIDKRESFHLDITRGYIALTKSTKQLRGRQVIPLLRLDLGGPPHRNPDDTEVPCPHLHIYREGFADKWAYPIPDSFKKIDDSYQTLLDFMNYCHITKQPAIQKGLFT